MKNYKVVVCNVKQHVLYGIPLAVRDNGWWQLLIESGKK